MYKGKPLIIGKVPWWRHHFFSWGWYSVSEVESFSGMSVEVEGYYRPGDHGGGLYVQNAAVRHNGWMSANQVRENLGLPPLTVEPDNGGDLFVPPKDDEVELKYFDGTEQNIDPDQDKSRMHPCYLEIQNLLKGGCDLNSEAITVALKKWDRSLKLDFEEVEQLKGEKWDVQYVKVLQTGFFKTNT